MGLWHTDESYQRIGDVIVKFSPFFKMYTEYVKNFDNAIHTINTLYAKNSKFSSIMDEIHVSIISCLFTKWWIGRAKVFRKPFCERVLMANSWLPPFRNFLWVFWLILPKLTHTLARLLFLQNFGKLQGEILCKISTFSNCVVLRAKNLVNLNCGGEYHLTEILEHILQISTISNYHNRN